MADQKNEVKLSKDFVELTGDGDMNIYAFTQTYNSKVYLGIQPGYQYDNTLPALEEALIQSAEGYVIFPELTDKGQIHWHGFIIVPNDTRSRYKFVRQTQTMMKYKGYCDFQKIGTKNRTVKGWLKYCTKDLDLYTKVFGRKRSIPVEWYRKYRTYTNIGKSNESYILTLRKRYREPEEDNKDKLVDRMDSFMKQMEIDDIYLREKMFEIYLEEYKIFSEGATLMNGDFIGLKGPLYE